MMGSLLTRGILMIVGYLYPAYECFKTVEKKKTEIEQLRFWCQYWIIVALLTVFERIGDAFVSWLPMYGEAKLAFIVYLWHPRTMGACYVYETFLHPFVARHETEIDRNLLELQTKAGDMAVLYWQKTASYGQTRFFEVLQYVASQSSNPRPAQPAPRQPNPSYFRPAQGVVADHLPVAEQPQQAQPPPLGKTCSATSQQQETQQAPQPPHRQSISTANQPPEPQRLHQAPPRQSSNKSPQRGSAMEETIRSVLQSTSVPQTEACAPPTQPPSVSPPNENQAQTAASERSTTRTQGQPPKQAVVEPSVSVNAGKSTPETASTVSNGDESAPSTEAVVMEDAIQITRARLRRSRMGKQNGG